jgi:hypothetical protein
VKDNPASITREIENISPRLFKTDAHIVCEVTDVWGFVYTYTFERGTAKAVRSEIFIPAAYVVPFVDEEKT